MEKWFSAGHSNCPYVGFNSEHQPEAYTIAYPDFLYFMKTGGGDMENLSSIDQTLFELYMTHWMRTYQGQFHVNPDYACRSAL